MFKASAHEPAWLKWMDVDVFVFVRLPVRVWVCAWAFLYECVTSMRQAQRSRSSGPGPWVALARLAMSLDCGRHGISIKEGPRRASSSSSTLSFYCLAVIIVMPVTVHFKHLQNLFSWFLVTHRTCLRSDNTAQWCICFNSPLQVIMTAGYKTNFKSIITH